MGCSMGAQVEPTHIYTFPEPWSARSLQQRTSGFGKAEFLCSKTSARKTLKYFEL